MRTSIRQTMRISARVIVVSVGIALSLSGLTRGGAERSSIRASNVMSAASAANTHTILLADDGQESHGGKGGGGKSHG